MDTAMKYSVIAGTGSFLPERVVSNDALAAELATRDISTSDEWIVERTGIRQRHLAERGVTTSQLAEAARRAMADAGVEASEIDLIVLATSTPDFVFPSTACLVQANLGAKGSAAFDVQAVCSGFVYALTTADSFIRAGRALRALVIGAEVFSRILDWNDRKTCVLFGDGAGAVILKASDKPGILAAQLHADGSQTKILSAEGNVAYGRHWRPLPAHGRPGRLQAGRHAGPLRPRLCAEAATPDVSEATGCSAPARDPEFPRASGRPRSRWLADQDPQRRRQRRLRQRHWRPLPRMDGMEARSQAGRRVLDRSACDTCAEAGV